MSEIKCAKPKFLTAKNLNLDYGKFAIELSNAQYALGLLQGSLKKLHNPLLLVSPLTAKEAEVSSRIEGTCSTVSDVFVHEAGGATKFEDVVQVKNYRSAIINAVDQIKKGRKLTPHLLKSLHSLLLNGVRYKGELGKFRKDRVWIAEKEGDPIEKAIYIPPEPHFVNDYVEDIFNYLNKEDLDPLIIAGLIHYQFEAVHPFNDGNGRIGRLLIPLILYYKQKVSQPIIYMSGYLDKNREQYTRELHDTDLTGEFESWLKFFFQSVAVQLGETQDMIEAIYSLYDTIKKDLEKIKSPYLNQFIDFIFKTPIFTIPMVIDAMPGVARLTVDRLLKDVLIKNNYVKPLKGKKGKAKLYAFDPLLRILQ